MGRKFEHEMISGFALTKWAPVQLSDDDDDDDDDDDEYGNFEADIKPHHRGQSQGRRSRK